MEKKTLGGDRLGTGKKMQVEMKNFERSTHDQGFIWRSSMSAGTLVPFLVDYGLPGTTFDFDLAAEILTQPTIGPLFGSYKFQADVFVIPIRLYNALLHNNKLGIGQDMSQVKLPQIKLRATTFTPSEVPDLDNAQINPSCLLKYLGISGVAYVTATAVPTDRDRLFNALPILAYWDIYKNYYANKQEELGAVIHVNTQAIVDTIDEININTTQVLALSPATSNIPITTGDEIRIEFTGTEPIPSQVIVQTDQGLKSIDQLADFSLLSAGVLIGTYNGQFGDMVLVRYRMRDATDIITGKPNVVTFPLANLDSIREDILAYQSLSSPFTIPDDVTNTIPFSYLTDQPNSIPNALSTQEGLACKTYLNDLFNNWLKTENIQAISDATAIQVVGGEFTIDALILNRKIWSMLNQINAAGGSYEDWLDAVYVHDRIRRAETPMYMGSLIKELVFQEVVNTSQSEGQPLGTIAGKGRFSQKNKGGHIIIKIDEPSIVIGLASLTPRLDYSQGNEWHTHLQTMNDFHKPHLDQIGFQDLVTEQLAWWETSVNNGVITQKSAGKQPAWMNYMTKVNKCYGNFAVTNNQMFMTLNRRYESDPEQNPAIIDLTTYIDPSKFNYIFAETQLDAQNFWVQIAVDQTSRRKMSAKVMPHM